MMARPTLARLVEGLILAAGLAAFGYHMMVPQVVLVGSFEHQTIHLMLVLGLIFLVALRSARGWLSAGLSLAFLAASLAATGYVLVNLEHLEMVIGFPEPMDIAVGLLLVVVVIEATRRSWGLILPVVVSVFILYFMFGHLLPQPFYHRPFNLGFVTSYLSIGLSGIFGTFLSISANYVFLFVVFGTLLELLKVNDLFAELGKAAGRVLRGGPGQTAVVASAMVGSVTGAAVANVLITGSFTIPYMKRTGYRPHVAAAIEATASTGGQLMPPVMGASAFLMASFLGVSYGTVVLASLIPAILYFWSCMLSVQLIAVRDDLRSPREVIDRGLIARRLPLFLAPLGVLVALLMMRYSPNFAAFWGIVTVIAVSFLTKDTRPGFMEILRCLGRGAVTGAQIGIALACVGMMAQTLITTGMGTKIANLVEILSGGELWLALLITMCVSVVLGLGVPTTAAYALVAVVVVPVLVRMGVEPISAHFFAFYFAVVSAITPPVAMASLAAAGLAGADYVRTSIQAFVIALGGFVIPFLVVYNPVLVMAPESWLHGTVALVAIPIGMTALTMTIFNCGAVRFTVGERALSALCAVLILAFVVLRQDRSHMLEYPVLAVGLAAFAVLVLRQRRKARGTARAAPPPAADASWPL